MNRICDIPNNSGHAGRATLPARKRLNHRGSLSIDVSSAWHFITICAKRHAPWVANEVKIGRAVAPRPSETKVDKNDCVASCRTLRKAIES